MIFQFVVTVGICLVDLTTSAPADMFGILNILYAQADPDMNKQISREDFAAVIRGFDASGDGVILQNEFVSHWSALLDQTEEIATGFFQMFDTRQEGHLDQNSVDDLFSRFNTNFDLFISDKEFVNGFSKIYHVVPFVVLYNRVQNKYAGTVKREVFEGLFDSLKGTANATSISKKDLEKAWVDQNFGPSGDAVDVMEMIDFNVDDIISNSELGTTFDSLDTDNNDRVSLGELKMIRDIPKARTIDPVVG